MKQDQTLLSFFWKNLFLQLLAYCLLLSFSSLSYAWNHQVSGGKCKKSKASCYTTIGNAGDKQACCDPQSRALEICLRENPCESGLHYRWFPQDLPLKWYFNPNNMIGKSGFSKVTQKQVESTMKEAFHAWSKPKCTSFREKYSGLIKTTPNPSKRTDGIPTLYLPSPSEWVLMGLSPGVLAFTSPAVDSKTGRIVDADILFNPGPIKVRSEIYHWGVKPVQNKEMDLAEITAHEVGHVLGLAHTQFKTALMYYSARFNGVGPIFRRYGLSVDEVKAVCSIYKKTEPCQKDTDCGGCLQCIQKKCVPLKIQPIKELCAPCKAPQDCGGAKDICIRLPEGNRCAQACSSNECCPNGYRCRQIGIGRKMCIPDTGQCPAVNCKQEKDCGPGEQCKQGLCKPKTVTPSPTSCKKCGSHQECGQGNKCISFGCGIGRCAQPCSASNFCPNGYTCETTSSGRLCMPPNGICPCATEKQCDTGQACKSGFCQKAKGGSYCDICSNKAKCSQNHKCYATPDYSICLQPCGGNFDYPPGTPGSICGTDRSCLHNNECMEANGQPICLQSCKNHASCKSGGRCYQLTSDQSKRSLCLCRNDDECLPNQRCNRSILQGFGACVNQVSTTACPKRFECKPIGSNRKACLPASGKQGIGQECNRQKRCLDALTCVKVSAQDTNGFCMEECSQKKTCRLGGTCRTFSPELGLCICTSAQKCPQGRSCQDLVNQLKVCKASLLSCGNQKCDTARGENCTSCPSDCVCKQGTSCQEGKCANGGLTDAGSSNPKQICSINEQILICDQQLTHCEPECVTGCGCQSLPDPNSSALFLLLFSLLLFKMKRRKAKPSL